MNKRKPIRSKILWALVRKDGKFVVYDCGDDDAEVPVVFMTARRARNEYEPPGEHYRPVRVRVVEEAK